MGTGLLYSFLKKRVTPQLSPVNPKRQGCSNFDTSKKLYRNFFYKNITYRTKLKFTKKIKPIYRNQSTLLTPFFYRNSPLITVFKPRNVLLRYDLYKSNVRTYLYLLNVIFHKNQFIFKNVAVNNLVDVKLIFFYTQITTRQTNYTYKNYLKTAYVPPNTLNQLVLQINNKGTYPYPPHVDLPPLNIFKNGKLSNNTYDKLKKNLNLLYRNIYFFYTSTGHKLAQLTKNTYYNKYVLNILLLKSGNPSLNKNISKNSLYNNRIHVPYLFLLKSFVKKFFFLKKTLKPSIVRAVNTGKVHKTPPHPVLTNRSNNHYFTHNNYYSNKFILKNKKLHNYTLHSLKLPLIYSSVNSNGVGTVRNLTPPNGNISIKSNLLQKLDLSFSNNQGQKKLTNSSPPRTRRSINYKPSLKKLFVKLASNKVSDNLNLFKKNIILDTGAEGGKIKFT